MTTEKHFKKPNPSDAKVIIDPKKIKERLAALYAAIELPENLYNRPLFFELADLLAWLGRPKEAFAVYQRGKFSFENKCEADFQSRDFHENKAAHLDPPSPNDLFTEKGRKNIEEYIRKLRQLIANNPRSIALCFTL